MFSADTSREGMREREGADFSLHSVLYFALQNERVLRPSIDALSPVTSQGSTGGHHLASNTLEGGRQRTDTVCIST